MHIILLLLSLVFCGGAVEQDAISGTWEGKLFTKQNDRITIQFILKKQVDGSYTAEMNYPDAGIIKNAPAEIVKFKEGRLTLEITRLRGSFSGDLVKDAIVGKWRQPGSSLPLVLIRHRDPDPSNLEALLGEWVGKLEMATNQYFSIIFRFERQNGAKIVAFLEIPELGGARLPAENIVLNGRQLDFKIPSMQGEYTGIVGANSISGILRQPNIQKAFTVTKGRFYSSDKIEIPDDMVERLIGRWTGRIGPVSVVFRFEKNAGGKLSIFADSPEEGAIGIPVTGATLIEGSLNLRIFAAGAQYIGRLNENRIEGTWTQHGRSNPLALIKQ
jgi:hypothetical protein